MLSLRKTALPERQNGFNRHFYVFTPPRPLAEIDAEFKTITDRILTLIAGLTRRE